jgi:hypothetical protein
VPINAPDLQRVRMSLPYYRAQGWEPEILCVADHWPWQDGVREPALATTVPADVPVHSVRALPLTWTRQLGVNTLGPRAWAHLALAGSRILRMRRFDLVFFSTTQFITLTLGPLWRRMHGVPFVVDVQDPWLTDYYYRSGTRQPPGGWKYRLAHAEAQLLEPLTFRHAAGFMSVSPDYLADLAARYSEVRRVPRRTIVFGASAHDMAIARARPTSPLLARTRLDVVNWVYTGAAGPIMPHSLRVLFSGVAALRAAQPEAAMRLRLHFIGTSYAAPELARPSVMPEAVAAGVADLVHEVPQRVGHLDCLQVQTEADALLLLGSSDLAYSPSKLYPYFLAARPIISVAYRQSVLMRLVDELGCGHQVMFDGLPTPATDALVVNLANRALAGTLRPSEGRRDDLFQERYLAETLTGRQCELFDAAIQQEAPAL